jgi:hypothetical protein
MILIILALIDIIAGIGLLFPGIFPTLFFYLGIIMIVKGLSSLGGSLFSKEILFLIFGVVDIIVGSMLIFNFTIPWLWIFPILKGLYSFVIGLGSK